MRKAIIYMILFSSILIFNSQAFCEDEGVDIHGFISQGYLKSNDNNFLADTEDGSFEFNEMGLNFSTWLSDDLRLGMQFFARDMGEEGNDEIIIDWAFADYAYREWLGLRVGKMKLIGGLYNEVRDMDMLRVSALLPTSLYPELYRDTFTSIKGLGAYGKVGLGGAGSLGYNAQVGILPVSTTGGIAKAFQENVRKSRQAWWGVDTFDQDYYWTLQGKWEAPELPLGTIVLSGVYFELIDLYASGTVESADAGSIFLQFVGTSYEYIFDEMTGYYLGLEWTWNNWVLVAEYSKTDIEGTIKLSVAEFSSTAPFEGWYISPSYRFNEWFQLGGGYSVYYPRSKDKNGRDQPDGYDFLNWLKDSYISFRFDINENWITKLEGHYMDGFGAFTSATNNDADLEQKWYLGVLKVTYSF